jgi:hypothetical protein
MTPKTRQPSWKFKELIAALGDDVEVVRMIRDKGFDPPVAATIGHWRSRNSVPGKWAPLLIELAIEREILPNVSFLR